MEAVEERAHVVGAADEAGGDGALSVEFAELAGGTVGGRGREDIGDQRGLSR